VSEDKAPSERPTDGTGLLFTTLLTMAPEALARSLAADPARAALLVQAAAAMGLAAGKVRLGRMLLEGSGLPQDRTAAFRWFWSAAEQEDVEAWNMVGRCFENGWGVPIDYRQAARWFSLAANAGNAWAHYNLGHLLLNGLGAPRDAIAAVAHYRAASEQGHPRALNLLGRCYEQGWGLPADKAAAADCYRRSAEAGYFRGQFNHATMLHDAGAHDQALAWIERAAAAAPASSLAPIRAKLAEWQTARAGTVRDVAACP